jgi:hypothetical protein
MSRRITTLAAVLVLAAAATCAKEEAGPQSSVKFVREHVRVEPSEERTRFAPREEKVVRVEYVQEIREKRAIYIVTTTKQWMRSIDLAEFMPDSDLTVTWQ